MRSLHIYANRHRWDRNERCRLPRPGDAEAPTHDHSPVAGAGGRRHPRSSVLTAHAQFDHAAHAHRFARRVHQCVPADVRVSVSGRVLHQADGHVVDHLADH